MNNPFPVTSVATLATVVLLCVGTPPAAAEPDLSSIAEASVEAVVNIRTSKTVRQRSDGPRGQMPQHPFFDDPLFRHFFGPEGGPRRPGPGHQRSLGSGVIVTDDGIVLTNNHVVEQADEVRVTLSDGREFEAEMVGSDPRSDLAVVRMEDPPDDLKPISFGDSGSLRLAETVIAIGNPFGVGQTVTKGIVSATGRANVGIADYEDFIQTDAAINPGNSGGALINVRGELIGINTAIVSRSGGHQGIGFAIPSNMARQIMDSLIEHGEVVRGWLGVMIQEIDRDLADALDLEDSNGVLVADVTDDSPADKAGIERGDVIVSVDGEAMRSTGQLRNVIAGNGAGKKVRMEILRNGKSKTVRVTLGELPEELGGGPGFVEGAPRDVTVEALTKQIRDQLEIPERIKKGVVVKRLAPDGAAARAGLRRGDVVLEVDGKVAEGPRRFNELYERGKQSSLLLVYRGNGTIFVVVKKETEEENDDE